MTKISGSFSGVVVAIDDQEAKVRLESIHMWDKSVEAKVKPDDVVSVLRKDFMRQMPYPGMDSYVEGRMEHDTTTGNEEFLNLVRPV